MKKFLISIAAVSMAVMSQGANQALAGDTVVHRDGWSFDRSEFRDTPDLVAAARQKANGLPLTGWTEFDFSVSKNGWYELWIGGAPAEWPSDLFVDGQNVIRLGFATAEDMEGTPAKGKVNIKESNLFLAEGKHTVRFRRLGFPGALPGVWELRESAGDPSGSIQARVEGSPIVEVGGKMKLSFTGGMQKPVKYQISLKNELTQTTSPVGEIEFPEAKAPVKRELEIPMDTEGFYSVVAQVDGKTLHPSDLKAGYILATKAVTAQASSVGTKLQLAGIFTSGAVLQRQKPLPIWGWAAPGQEVSVSLSDQTEKATAGADGRWQVTLKPMEAGGPYTLTVSGSTKIVSDDIMLGEVWLLSGQSNTGGPLLTCPGGEEAAKAANNPNVRQGAIATSPVTLPGGGSMLAPTGWLRAQSGGDATKMKAWYGIPFGFGTKINQELGVPVAVVAGGRGGTFISTWTSLATHKSDPTFKAILESYESDERENLPAVIYLNKLGGEVAKWREATAKAATQGAAAPPAPTLSADLKEANGPGLNYERLIEPLAPFAIRGVLWYQGENDSGMAAEYKKRLPAMISDWRALWHDDSLPFVYAQIAYGEGKPYAGDPADSTNAELRDAQLKSISIPHTAMIVTHDLVQPTDNVHYLDKLPVGNRLAVAALATVYGKTLEYSGPIYRECKIESGAVRISFNHLGGGLAIKGDKLGGFSIAGDDHKWIWADARIDGDSVVVQSSTVPHPAAVRYAWTSSPCGANLINKAGLPASGFRTDDWPLKTEGIGWVQKN